MQVHEFHRAPCGMAWGVKLHRYADGAASFVVYAPGERPREVSLSPLDVLTLQKVLATQPEYLRDV